MNINKIWDIADTDDFVSAMSEYIGKKCKYGDKISLLSEPERVFFVTQTLEMEVNNGGFSQFFFNSSGDFSHEIVNAFTQIGAIKTVKICETAIAAWGREIPMDREARMDMLEEIQCDAIDEILETCDDAFYEYEDNLNELNYAYIMKNKDLFDTRKGSAIKQICSLLLRK